MKTKEPDWVCLKCATERGAKIPNGHIPTWHIGFCELCKEVMEVTAPRDFGITRSKLTLKPKKKMTQQEFNEKYKAYIEKGFENQGLMFDIPSVTEYLDKEFQKFIRVPEFCFSQIKFKFNSVRFYADNLPMEDRGRVETEVKRLSDIWIKERAKHTMKLKDVGDESI